MTNAKGVIHYLGEKDILKWHQQKNIMVKILRIIHKPPLLVVRMAFIICLVVMGTAMARAQEGLAVNNIFQQYGHSKGCKMVVMHNTRLRGYTLAVYQSLTYNRKYAAGIDAYMKIDRKSAKKIREVVDNGRMVSGYYMMQPLASGANRYVLFSRSNNDKGAVIYIEGNLSPDDIMKICYSRRYVED